MFGRAVGPRPPAKLCARTSSWSAVIRGHQGMKLAVVRAGTTCVFAMLVSSCGGGGGDGGNPPPPEPRFSVDENDVAIAAEPGDVAPTATVKLRVSDPPPAGIFLQFESSDSGIEYLNSSNVMLAGTTMDIIFKVPAGIPDGTYEDSIEVRACLDPGCAEEIAGSPQIVHTSYSVSGGIVGTLADDTVQATTDTTNPDAVEKSVRLDFDKVPGYSLSINVENTYNGIFSADIVDDHSDTAQVKITFNAGPGVHPGTYDDTVTITIRYEYSCLRQVGGSPFTISTQLTVNAGAEPGVDPLQVLGRVALAHDVVDAEYSKALDAIVMVGQEPANALYVYDTATGMEARQLL